MEIITKRFVLREFTEKDEPAFLTYHGDPRYAEFCSSEEVEADYTTELLRQFIQWAHEQPRRNYQLAVIRLENPKELLGCCGLRTKGYDADIAELGIELAPKYWGRYRYAIEVASAMLKFGFGELGLQEVRGVTISANTRVMRLAHRYGFVAVSSCPGSDWMHTRGWNQTQWQLTREKWESMLTQIRVEQ
ncbi:GCN5-related N-acetyltransferase [Nostoc minutum NIES-26]|uniref:GCN5-related N-acetyltransferase n=1 Tax=Nostoc minutum NIES-26 TaxID=1844469 RepID=A0A367R7Z6_9NOSO|nr:GCN5-related N-acetyltransferase [Nostoc minutum NIES-26]